MAMQVIFANSKDEKLSKYKQARIEKMKNNKVDSLKDAAKRNRVAQHNRLQNSKKNLSHDLKVHEKIEKLEEEIRALRDSLVTRLDKQMIINELEKL